MNSSQAEYARFPVFVFPNELNFSFDSNSQKKVLTIYNPYDYAIYFKVLTTRPSKFFVATPEGSIKPHCCFDIPVRHLCITKEQIGIKDKLRIEIADGNASFTQVVNRKDIICSVVESPDQNSFQNLPNRVSATGDIINSEPAFSENSVQRESSSHRKTGGILVAVAIFCISVLLLPYDGDPNSINSYIPTWIHPSVTQKLITAYVLGLITMAIMQY